MIKKKMNNVQEYFDNNGKGFYEPHVVKINDLNIKIEIYHNNLKANKVSKIESDIGKIANKSKSFFNLDCSDKERVVKIYIFDDKDDYGYLGGIESFNLGLGKEGGKFYQSGISGVPEIYLYQQGGICNLQHELAHFFTHLATKGESLPTVLMEGIADYFEHNSDYKFNSQGSSVDITKDKDLSLSEILKLEYSEDDEQNSLVYKTGHALVMYLQENDPYLLKNLIDSKRFGDVHNSEKFLKKIIESDNDFKNWLDTNRTEIAMQDINALHITKGKFILTKKEVVDGEVKDVLCYKANIDKVGGENVGDFSPVTHVSFYNHVRVINRATDDYLDIPKEYHFLKIIKNSDKDYRLTYCDKEGNDYQDTENYKTQAFRIISNYDERIKNIIEKFNQLKHKEVGDDIKYCPRVEKILEELITIDPELIGNIPLQKGEIFSLKSLGKGITGALSVYDANDEKLGELLSEVGFFKQVEGQTKEVFLFEDILHNMHVRYDGGVYVGITKENDHYRASFIDGREVESDAYFNDPHLHENELLNPNIKHIKAEDLDSLQLRNIKILNHKNSQSAQYSEKQGDQEEGIIVEKGELLDNKGTDRIDDDVYEAVVEQEGNSLYTFKNIGFYISEEIKNTEGEVVSHSGLLIHDYGKNIRFQLPNSITHLKLVGNDGNYKLVPCTENGYEHPDGMPDIPDEYRYIDQIFAHEYEKKDYSHKHVNIGLINFDKYKPGTLFSVKFDPNDYQIPKNLNGEIVRTDDRIYFTKVKLFYDDEEIGMLSNSFHNFKDKIFFSADYNYSYNDFLASVSPRVHIEDIQDRSKKITFDQGKGDIEEVDKGYTDYQKIFFKETPINTFSFTEILEFARAKRSLEKDYTANSIEREAEELLFPNKEDLLIDNNLAVEIKYGELISYTPDYIKQTVRAAYEAWCSNFYQQKDTNYSVAKLQLYIFKDYDDYKKYIKEFSGKSYNELWGGGTIRANDADGTIAKTFIFANMGSLPCVKSGYIMEKMSDAFLEYATDDLNKIPEVLRTGMKHFMWSYNIDKKEVDLDAHYIKEAYDEMQSNRSSNMIDMAKDYRVADCLVRFLQVKHLYFINNLINEARFNKCDVKTELEQFLNNTVTEKEFKEWMNNVSGNQMMKELLPDNDMLLLAEDNITVNIRYDTEKLNYNELSNIKNTITNTIRDFNVVFSTNNSRIMPNNIDLYLFNTKDDYKNNLEKLNIHTEDSNGLTMLGRGSDIHVYVYLHDQQFIKTLKHELGHALTIIDSYYGAGDCLPIAMHEGLANYIAGVEDGRHVNDYGDIKALSMIKDKNLKPDEILNNNYRLEYYYSEAEQVIKFLEERHPDLLNGLIKNLANHGTNMIEGKKLVEDFIKDVKNYGLEFSDWVTEQINTEMGVDIVQSKEPYSIAKRSLDHKTIEEHAVQAILKDTILKIQKSYDQDSQGKHKACIVIDYYDIKSLYDKAEETEKSAVLEFWNKLHQSNYKVGVLPEEKYYFENGKFVIYDNQEKKYTALDEDKVSIKIIKLGDSCNLVLTNLEGNVMCSIDKNGIEELNYELSDNLFMGEQSEIINEYEFYLSNGLESIIFNNANEYDYNLI